MSKVLAIDPGAKRLGWAVLDDHHDDDVKLIDSGILGVDRGDGEAFQAYKLRLINYFAQKVPVLLRKHLPTVVVSETQPAVGGGNFIAATQSELAKTAVTIFHAFAYAGSLKVIQIGASTIKKAATGDSKATKAKVRNSVIKVFPDIAEELKKETTGEKKWDRSDAIAIGLAYFSARKV